MSLHDRLKTTGNGHHPATTEDGVVLVASPVLGEAVQEPAQTDPYAELKTRVHHAVIAQLGPQLFTTRTSEDLSDRVLRAVTEQVMLDGTPLTRDERRQLVREITDDILGYGPLEPLLHDDSVTEIMVNNYDKVFIERAGRIERARQTFADNAHLLRIIDKIVSQVGRRIDEASPMVTGVRSLAGS